MSERAYLNGQLIEIGRATVTVSNPALLHGVGLFETLRAYDGKPFRLRQHTDRLGHSARHFDMPVLDVLDQIPEAVRSVLEANSLKHARIRFTVTPPAPHGQSDRPTGIRSSFTRTA
jgi:branched-subunit amino acid aminotransferase/4-amino-4-deoxychorismate lyase